MIQSGVYCIRNLANGMVYVGSAIKMRSRWKEHRRQLQKNCHHSRKLQMSWNKYGENGFIFEVIEIVEDSSNLITREQYWIDLLHAASRSHGFNISPTAGSALGVKRPLVVRAKMAASARNRTEEHSAKIRESLIARNKSQEQIAKLKARNRSEEMRARTAASNSARIWSAESRAKLSASLTGREISLEARLKLSAVMKGRKLPPDRAEKQRKILVARNRSVEQRAKVSAANKRRAAMLLSNRGV